MAININLSIPAAFGLQVNKTVREKAYFICDTSAGLFKISKTAEPPERIIFQHKIKEHIIDAGYPWTDRYRESQTGQPYVIIGGDMWTAVSCVKCREADFENTDDFERIVKAVRRWHICARSIPVENDSPQFLTPPLTEYFRKQAAELSSVAKRVRRQSRLSDLDVLLIKNVASYTEKISKAINLLETSKYSLLYERAKSNGHICHQTLKEESLAVGEQIYITHYENSGFGAQITDLASLIRRHVQRAGLRAVPAMRALEAADKAEPLSDGTQDILYALLLFPWQFMKTVSQYYNKKRTWTPNVITNRMQTVVYEAGLLDNYIKDLIP